LSVLKTLNLKFYCTVIITIRANSYVFSNGQKCLSKWNRVLFKNAGKMVRKYL
jgi:hypothetical protein